MKTRGRQAFTAKLFGMGPTRGWARFILPFSVEKVWGTKAQVRVAGTLNGVAFRKSAMPRGDGTHFMMVPKALRDAAGAAVGSRVRIAMGVDTQVRRVAVPADLRRALAERPALRRLFDARSYSCRKEWALYVGSARRVQTRARRIAEVLRGLSP